MQALADYLKPYIFSYEHVPVTVQEAVEIRKKDVYLLTGPVPIFGRKGINAQGLYSLLFCLQDDLFYALRSPAVSGSTRQAALPGPAAVSVHNNGYVVGDVTHRRILHAGLPLAYKKQGGICPLRKNTTVYCRFKLLLRRKRLLH